MIEMMMTSAATTLTMGATLGRDKLLKIQIGSVSMPGTCGELGDDDLVE